MEKVHGKRKIYIPLLFCILLLVGCSGGSDISSQNEGKSTNAGSSKVNRSGSEKNTDTAKTKVIDDSHPISGMREEKLGLSEYGLGYKVATDAQPEYLWTSVARAENGYYIWGKDFGYGRLMYFDTASQSYIPLCNKPNCAHNSKGCNAFFNSNGEEEIAYIRSYIQYYDGCVYVVGHDGEGYVYLYKVSPDGSTCEKYMTLYKADLSSTKAEGENVKEFSEPEVCIHRGYIYFLIGEESGLKLRRIKLGGEDVEIVFENAGSRPSLYRMQAYGDYLFFQSGNFIDDDYIDIEAGIFALNVNTAKVQLVKKDAVSAYAVSDGDLYYATVNGINRYSLKEQKDAAVVDTGARGDIAVHGKTIYFYRKDTYTLSQYDSEGKLLNEVMDVDFSPCRMGDEDYFFALGSGKIGILSVKGLSEGAAKWTPLGE
ncbi:MAG: DUF5050 domain-containing protein [Lachnospiraceae bacterium]|nr:DUF5050 domain-containing protein [Lachnospiraceae bacterium]